MPEYQQQSVAGVIQFVSGVATADTQSINQGVNNFATGWGDALQDPHWW